MLRIRITWDPSGVIRLPWDGSPHRSGTDQPTKSASRFRIDRIASPLGVRSDLAITAGRGLVGAEKGARRLMGSAQRSGSFRATSLVRVTQEQ
jgi:hypothetical protein